MRSYIRVKWRPLIYTDVALFPCKTRRREKLYSDKNVWLRRPREKIEEQSRVQYYL